VRAWSEVPRDRPLFESLVAFENFPLGEPLKRWRGGPRIEDVIAADHTHYPLTLLAALDPDLSLTLLFARGRFEEPVIGRLEGHLGALLAGMAAGEERPLSALSLLTPAEAAQIAAWTAGAPPEGEGASVHRLFAAQAARTPEAVALISAGEGGARLTYRELEERSNRLARRLRALGVGPEVPVALCVGRSLDAVVGLLAILKTGGFCVPLDAAYPRDRLALMLEDSRPAALLTWERLAAELPAAAATLLLDDRRERAAIEALSPEPPDTPDLPGSLAYVIYTSGSTGRPKGVAVFHRLLSNIVAWQMAAGATRGPRRTLQFSPWSFDVCLQEIFSTLGTGGTLVLLAEEWRADGPRLWRLIEEERIERLFIPFVALELLAESAPAGEPLAPGLAEIAAAGEQLQITPAVAALFSRLPGCVLENHYGPTETHIVVTFTLAGPPASWPPLPPIGRAIAGARATVLDDGLRPVPVGVVGEVCLGGIAVCRGYLGRPDLTAERFPPDPLSREPGVRLYRSGDLGRWREDGQIEFLGRRDGQVKVRGYRVELGEIEAVLATHPAVLRAAVVARKRAGGTRLLAAVVPRPERKAEEGDLREHLRERLPAYMVPADLMTLDELPQTPSGKVDRKALALLKAERPVSTPPGTEIERDLAALWAEVLGAPGVGLEDGFFELGGHSLLAGRLLARVRKAFGIDLPLASLLEDPTLGGMARALDAALVARAEETDLDALLDSLDSLSEEEAERLLAEERPR
jgi:amino acid adenylation domain-containing protein